MKSDKNIIICGARGVGKSTLIRRLTDAFALAPYGFYTKRFEEVNGVSPVYMFDASEKQRTPTAGNMVGSCGRGRLIEARPSVFDSLGVKLIKSAKPDGVLIMDELGFMERDATLFLSAVLDALGGSIPVIAAVKDKPDVEFLSAVRQHPKSTVYMISPNNRDELYRLILREHS